MIKKYYSKISYGLLTVVFIVFFTPVITILANDKLHPKMILVILFLIIIYGFIVYLFFNTTYIIDNNLLRIKCGFFSYKPIKINSIKEISKSSNIISSPAASFDRIEVKHGKYGEIILSPKNKFNFAADLKKINPHIKNNIHK